MSRPPAGSRPWRHRMTRTIGVVLVPGFLLVVLIGAAVSSAFAMLVMAPGLGAFAAIQVALTRDRFPGRRSARRSALRAGVAGFLVVPYMAGATLLGVVGGLFTLALLAVCVLAGVSRLREVDLEVRSAAGSRAGNRAGTDTETHEAPRSVTSAPPESFLALMPTAKLLEEWRRTGAELRCGVRRRHVAAVELRALLLEELSRRDPGVVDRLVAEGGDVTARRHPRDDSGLAM